MIGFVFFVFTTIGLAGMIAGATLDLRWSWLAGVVFLGFAVFVLPPMAFVDAIHRNEAEQRDCVAAGGVALGDKWNGYYCLEHPQEQR